MPWWRAWPDSLSSIARERVCTCTPRRLASSTSSPVRGLWLPCSTRISRTREGSLASAPATGLMPTIQCSRMLDAFTPLQEQRRAATDRNVPQPWSFPACAPAPVRLRRICTRAHGGSTLRTDQPEIDPTILHAGAQHLDAHPVAQAEDRAGAFAAQFMAAGIELVVVVAQLGDVHQARHLRLSQLDEQSERGDAGDDAVELRADVLLHPRTLVAVVDVALGLLCTSFGPRALRRHGRHLALGVEVRRRLAAGQRIADRAVHQQVRVTPDGRGEMRIRGKRES